VVESETLVICVERIKELFAECLGVMENLQGGKVGKGAVFGGIFFLVKS